MTITALKDNKGFKRICGGCAARFYDLNKSPIVCPKCGEEFTGAAKVKSRRSRKSAEEDATTLAKEEADVAAAKEEKETVSLDELEKSETADSDDDDDEEDLSGDLDLDELANIDDNDDDDDYEDGDDLDLTRVTSDS